MRRCGGWWRVARAVHAGPGPRAPTSHKLPIRALEEASTSLVGPDDGPRARLHTRVAPESPSRAGYAGREDARRRPIGVRNVREAHATL